MGELLWQHGLGDLVTYLKYNDPADLTHIVWSRRYEIGKALLESNHETAHITHSRAPHVPPEVPDQWIRDLEGLPYLGSPWSRLPRLPTTPYLVIQPTTAANPELVQRLRNFTSSDWDWAIAYLAEADQVGVVVNGPGAAPAPSHPNLIDVQGTTTIDVTLRMLLNSSAYIGIDSWLSIVATEVLPPERIKILSRNPWVYTHACTLYAPITISGCLYPTFPDHP